MDIVGCIAVCRGFCACSYCTAPSDQSIAVQGGLAINYLRPDFGCLHHLAPILLGYTVTLSKLWSFIGALN